MGTLVTWFLVRCGRIQIVMLDRVVAATHVVTQEATSYRTGIPVVGRIKNSFGISLLLVQNHRDVVVKTQRRAAFASPLLKIDLTHMLLRLRWTNQITSRALADNLGDPSF
jgi:hypothetical protein